MILLLIIILFSVYSGDEFHLVNPDPPYSTSPRDPHVFSITNGFVFLYQLEGMIRIGEPIVHCGCKYQFNTYDIYASIHDNEGGVVVKEFRVSNDSEYSPVNPTGVRMDDEKFAVAYAVRYGNNNTNTSYDIVVKIFNNKKQIIKEGVIVNTRGEYLDQRYPILSYSNHTLFVAWERSFDDWEEYYFYASILDDELNIIKSEFLLNHASDIFHNQRGISISNLRDGNFFVAFHTYHTYYYQLQVHFIIFDANGEAISEELLVSDLNYANNDFSMEPKTAVLEDSGNVVICYDAAGNRAMCQIYDSSGEKVKEQFKVNILTDNDKQKPRVVALERTGFYVQWEDDNYGDVNQTHGVYGQFYNQDYERVNNADLQINQDLFGYYVKHEARATKLDDGNLLSVHISEKAWVTRSIYEVIGRIIDVRKCFGISHQIQDKVCGGHGNCTYTDVCTCNNREEYYGGSCHIHYKDESDISDQYTVILYKKVSQQHLKCSKDYEKVRFCVGKKGEDVRNNQKVKNYLGKNFFIDIYNVDDIEYLRLNHLDSNGVETYSDLVVVEENKEYTNCKSFSSNNMDTVEIQEKIQKLEIKVFTGGCFENDFSFDILFTTEKGRLYLIYYGIALVICFIFSLIIINVVLIQGCLMVCCNGKNAQKWAKSIRRYYCTRKEKERSETITTIRNYSITLGYITILKIRELFVLYFTLANIIITPTNTIDPYYIRDLNLYNASLYSMIIIIGVYFVVDLILMLQYVKLRNLDNVFIVIIMYGCYKEYLIRKVSQQYNIIKFLILLAITFSFPYMIFSMICVNYIGGLFTTYYNSTQFNVLDILFNAQLISLVLSLFLLFSSIIYCLNYNCCSSYNYVKKILKLSKDDLKNFPRIAFSLSMLFSDTDTILSEVMNCVEGLYLYKLRLNNEKEVELKSLSEHCQRMSVYNLSFEMGFHWIYERE